jgi:hypothetical protein
MYSIAGLPGGLSLNSTTGLISGTIAAGDASSNSYSVTASVNVGTLTATQSWLWGVVDPLSVVALDDQANSEGDSVSLQVSASDLSFRSLSFSASNLPSGLSIDSSSVPPTSSLRLRHRSRTTWETPSPFSSMPSTATTPPR